MDRGFRNEDYKSNKFKRLQKKLVTIVPSSSVVGILLNNDKYKVIKSNAKAFLAHDMLTWNIFGECFLENKLSKISKKLHNTVITGLGEIEPDMLKETLETLLASLQKDYNDKFEIDFNDLKLLIKNRKNMDPKISKYLLVIINTLMESLATKEE